MPRFDFPLQGVLRHRYHVEEQRQRELARLRQEMNAAEETLRTMDQTVQANVADVRQNRLTGKLDLSFLAAHRRYMAAAQRQAVQVAQRMALIQRQIDEAQHALAEAAKQRKIIEKLREKQHARWAGEVARKEAADLDEVNTGLSAWRSMTEDARSAAGAGS